MHIERWRMSGRVTDVTLEALDMGCVVVSSAVSLFLLKQQHGELGAGTETFQVALNTSVIDVFTKPRVAVLVAVLLVQCWLHCPEYMQTRILDEHVVDVQGLENLLILLDVCHHSRTCCHVVRVVKTCFFK